MRFMLGSYCNPLMSLRGTFELCQLCRHLKELLHADGEIRSVQQSAAALRRERLHLIQLCVPAGRAHNDAAADGQHRANVFNRRLGRCEVHNNIHARQGRCSQCRRVRILVDIERAHAMAALARYFSDKRAGLSLAQHKNQHRFLHCDDQQSVSGAQLCRELITDH